jgi:hypothetical protein
MGALLVLSRGSSILRCLRATSAAAIAAGALFAFGATGVALAADYEDANHNVCEGVGCFNANLVANGASNNAAFGDGMMPALTSGFENVAIDTGALHANSGGSFNIAIGFDALEANTFGSHNLALGSLALVSNTEGFDNVALGTDALSGNTLGTDNFAGGRLALNANTTGDANAAIGTNALTHNTVGNGNVAVGVSALQNNTNGNGNVALGGALIANTTGINNIASGTSALVSNTTGGGNFAGGLNALKKNSAGSNNIAIGGNSLLNSTGSSNIALGHAAGTNLTTGSSNVDIANGGVAAESQTIRIGSSQRKAFLAGVNNVSIAGPTQTVLVNASGQLGTATASSARLKRDVQAIGGRASRVLSLRPVSYRYKQGRGLLQFGLIAEQVARVFPSLVQYSGRKPAGVYYQELPVLLLAQLKRDDAQVHRQQREINALASQVKELRAMLRH